MRNYSAGQYSEAISTLKAYVEQKPGDGTAWAVMGLAEFETKNYDNALIHLERGNDLGLGGSRDSVQLARYRLGVLLNQSGKFENATKVMAPSAESGPLAKEVQFALGMSLLRMATLPDQVDTSQHALVQTSGEIGVLLENSKYDDAFAKFQLLLKQYPSAPFLHYAYGTALEALSQYDQAEVQMREELKHSPASALPYVRLSSIALKRYRPADALPSAQRAVGLAPDSAEAHYVLGRSFLELGQEDEAIHQLEIAGKLSPGSPEVHFNLAKAYAKAKQPEKAEQERAIFVRLNALAEQQRSAHGNQSYSGPREATEMSVPAGDTPEVTPH
jgi:tetratricopeptide (TPR) repeat protein